MRPWVALPLGVLLGIMLILGFQGVILGVSAIPGINLIPGITDLLAPRPAPTPPAPAPTPAPSPTPRVIQVDLERAKMVNKTTYSEMGYTIHLTSKAPSIQILGRGFFDKEMLIIVSGACRAGVDYEASPAEIDSSGTRVSVRIPEPEIFGCDVGSVEYFDGKGVLPAPPSYTTACTTRRSSGSTLKPRRAICWSRRRGAPPPRPSCIFAGSASSRYRSRSSRPIRVTGPPQDR